MTLVRFMPVHESAILPTYGSSGAAGLDLSSIEELFLHAGKSRLVRTGLRIEIEPGYEGQVRPRSGLAVKHGVTVLNSPGTIDCDFRGEVQILLINMGRDAHVIRVGDRIAQLVIAPVVRATPVWATTLTDSPRGADGWGSTGR